MNPQQSTMLRRVALWIAGRAGTILPPARREWADAMLGEIHHIESDVEALRWAVGCFVASCIEAARTQPTLELLPVRLMVSLVFVQRVFNDLYSTTLKLAYDTHHFGLAARLGWLTPGGDYRPFIPLLNAVPVWMYAIYTAAALLYLLAGIRYVRRLPSALAPFLVALCVEEVASSLMEPFYAATGIMGDTQRHNPFGMAMWLSIVSVLSIVLWKRDSMLRKAR